MYQYILSPDTEFTFTGKNIFVLSTNTICGVIDSDGTTIALGIRQWLLCEDYIKVISMANSSGYYETCPTTKPEVSVKVITIN